MIQIYVHELLHALATSQHSRPRPIEGGDGMTAIPVVVSLWVHMPDGRRVSLEIPVTRADLCPYSPATDTRPCQTPEFILTVSVPLRYTVTDTESPAPPPETESPAADVDPEAPAGIPELDHYPPDFFLPDTTRPFAHYDKTDKMSDEYKNTGTRSDE